MRPSFSRFGADELERFLTAIDRALTRRTFVILIGGGAAALGYGVRSATKDLDTLTSTADLEDAIRTARAETGLDIPIEATPVADLPYEFESRLVRVLPALLVRANAGDLAAVEELHGRHPLSFETLVGRYQREMTHAVGDPVRLDQNFLLGVQVLFGERARDDARGLLRRRHRNE